MINLQKIKKVGYGFGFGGTFANKAKYTKVHKDTLKFFCNCKKGNFIDTAIIYGSGASEKLIGNFDKKIKKNLFISTKVSPENLSYKNFINSTLQSLKNLKVKKIDLIQPHWPNYQIDKNEIVKAFKYLKQQGKVRYFGLSNYDLKDVRFFKKKLGKDFQFVQEYYSIRDRSLEKNIKYYEKYGLKIVCYSPLGTGGLKFSEKESKLLKQLSKKYQKNSVSIILNYLSSKSKNIILIPNTKKIKHLKDNLESIDYKIKRTDIKKIDKSFKVKYVNLKLKDVIYKDKKYKKIKSLQDAIENKGKLIPSPIVLANKLKEGNKVKHIKLKKIKNKYYLCEGRLKFWAHVIAFGWNKKLEMIVS